MNKSIIILAFSLFIIGCNNKNENSEKNIKLIAKQFSLSEVKDINSIVEAIITQDSLEVLKSADYSNYLCDELTRLPIDFPEKQANGLTPPLAPGRIYLTELLNDKINDEIFFAKKDSSNLIAQNSKPSIFKIDKLLLININTTSFEKENIKRKKGKNYRFYEMTIPIFSLDNRKAYVELGYHCGALCGHGKAIFLKKINEKWIIVKKFGTWVS
ncbi:hypothetical protein L1S34_06520 [Flavobacterium sp. K77]|uniref:hypothetical protein n=1 Tax=Flavobacterium sp. K77 TaxID=2910676 RepID=UPI001F29265B|nr:hypothetical protein [Flavobacterium sp. K77]MCF6140935.1 hypothetical protein [Flavobacterium sp. K77]